VRGRSKVLALGAAACLTLALGPQPPRLMWNATASVPIGFYRLSPPDHLTVGQLVVMAPSPVMADLLARRGWLPPGVPLIKPVAALGGQTVCRQGEVILIDGLPRALARRRDRQGRRLPAWSGCRRLQADELFVLAPPVDSFDGRYLGVTSRRDVQARAEKLSGGRP